MSDEGSGWVSEDEERPAKKDRLPDQEEDDSVKSRANPNFRKESKSLKKANGYLLYARNRRREVEEETGVKLEIPLTDLLSRFDDDWKNLPDSEKQKWKDKAKQMNGKEVAPRIRAKRYDRSEYPPVPGRIHPEFNKKNDLTKALSGLEPLHYPRDVYTVKEFIEQSVLPIEERLFVVVNFNNYVITNINPFIPAEIGYAAFSLKNGINSFKSYLIDPGMPGIRSSFDTKMITRRLGLPKPIFDEEPDEDQILLQQCGTNNYLKIISEFDALLDKVHEGEEKLGLKIFIFTYDEDVTQVEWTFKWLFRVTDQPHRRLKVFKMDELVLELLQLKNVDENHIRSLKYELDRGFFRQDRDLHYNSHLACEWHKQEEYEELMHNCAMHKTNRLIYLTMGILVPNFDMELLPNVHLPPEVIRKPSTIVSGPSNERNPFMLLNEEEDIREAAMEEYQQTQPLTLNQRDCFSEIGYMRTQVPHPIQVATLDDEDGDIPTHPEEDESPDDSAEIIESNYRNPLFHARILKSMKNLTG